MTSIINQNWNDYTAEQHGIWDMLYTKLADLLPDRAAPDFMAGLDALDLHKGGIPNLDALSDCLEPLTGWRIVGVPGLISDPEFFELLANRRFPASTFIRRPDQINYIQEPDIFHDIFGHVPMLSNPVFADYMQAYGEGGIKSLKFHALRNLAALYWYTVEFGLIKTPDGLRIYGAGIVSSPAETVFSLESRSPNRIKFSLKRVMQTDYKIDDFQQTYFVIDSYDELFKATAERDFTPIYRTLANKFEYSPEQTLPKDQIIHHGDQAHHRRAASICHGKSRQASP